MIIFTSVLNAIELVLFQNLQNTHLKVLINIKSINLNCKHGCFFFFFISITLKTPYNDITILVTVSTYLFFPLFIKKHLGSFPLSSSLDPRSTTALPTGPYTNLAPCPPE